jgi:hypothetical protein
MFNDKSGQLMLISAFMLAMAVVVISLMLNNVIYAGNLAYVGFMDQTRYDDLNFKQTTAAEMNYAYNKYIDSVPQDFNAYNMYIENYKDTINSITSIKGRYIELEPASVFDPHALIHQHNQKSLSIYSKYSSARYAITTGTDTVPKYTIVLSDPSQSYIINNGVSKTSFTVEVKQDGSPVPDKTVNFWSSSNYGKFTAVSPVSGKTDNQGELTVDYSDTGSAGFVDIIAYIGSDRSDSKRISVTSATQPTYIIDVAPHSTQSAPLNFISTLSDANILEFTVTVTDAYNNPQSGVTVQFHIVNALTNTVRDTSSITDIPYGNTGNLVTGPTGTLTVYYHDTGENMPDMAKFYVTDDDGQNPSNDVYIDCQSPNMYDGNPVIASTPIVPDRHANAYTITIPVDFNPLVDCNIVTVAGPTSDVAEVTISNTYFSQTGPSTGNLVIVVNIPANVNPPFTLTYNARFTATCNEPGHNPTYSKDGTVTVTGNKDSVIASVTYP